MEGVGVHAPGEDLARVGHGRVVRSGESRDRVQQDDHVLLVLHQSLRLLEHHLRHLGVPVRRLVERGGDDLGRHVLLHVRDLLRALVDEKDDQFALRMIVQDGVGDLLEENGLTRLRRRDDEAPLSLSDGRDEIEDAHRDVAVVLLQVQLLLGISRAQVVEADPVLGLFRVLAVDRLYLQQRQILLALLGRPDLAGHGVTRSHVEALDLRRGDVYVVWAVEVVPILTAEEAVAFRQNLENSLAAKDDIRVEEVLLDAKDQVLLSKARVVVDAQLLGHLVKVGDGFGLQFCNVHGTNSVGVKAPLGVFG